MIGVTPDVHLRGVTTAVPQAEVFMPLAAQRPYGSVTVAVAVASPAMLSSIGEAVQRQIASVDPDLPLYNPLRLADVRARFLANQRLTLAISSAFGLAALVLCAIGLYGVLAQAVAQRTRELGIRLALGAHPGRLRRGVVVSGARLAIGGVLIGALGSGVAARLIARFVPALDAPSPAAIAIDAMVLLAIAVLAAWVPARRASTIDPLVALRQ